ncbi:hypothetical protein [Yunchengibacter salinarum]|uniref:hypothetical protein n=1 Tax=Yunchengibacter salinarum TaxID=3133399 RepID=UPI0035B69B4D
MLTELAHALTARAAPGARRLGLVRESAAITARARRLTQQWHPHLAASKAAIQTFLTRQAGTGPLLIWGAGAGHDLPFDALARWPDRVVLADAVLPLSLRRRAGRWPHMRLHCGDATGLLGTYAALPDGAAITVPDPAPLLAPIRDMPPPGAVISLNLLSQLPRPFVGAPPHDSAASALARALIRAHLAALAALPALVISDVRLHQGTANKAVDTIPPDLHPPAPQGRITPHASCQTWDWALAPPGDTTGPERLTVMAWRPMEGPDHEAPDHGAKANRMAGATVSGTG